MLGAGFDANATGDAFEGFSQVVVIKHDHLGAKTNAAQAAYTKLLVNANDAIFVTIDGVCRAHIDAFTTLCAFAGMKGVEIVDDADG